jgi:hypothetical protein
LGKKPRYDFVPRKSLEEVIDVLKERVSPAPTVEPTQGFLTNQLLRKIAKIRNRVIQI